MRRRRGARSSTSDTHAHARTHRARANTTCSVTIGGEFSKFKRHTINYLREMAVITPYARFVRPPCACVLERRGQEGRSVFVCVRARTPEGRACFGTCGPSIRTCVDQAYVCRRTERTRRTRRTRVCLKLELDAVRACCPVWPVWDSAVRMIGSA